MAIWARLYLPLGTCDSYQTQMGLGPTVSPYLIAPVTAVNFYRGFGDFANEVNRVVGHIGGDAWWWSVNRPSCSTHSLQILPDWLTIEEHHSAEGLASTHSTASVLRKRRDIIGLLHRNTVCYSSWKQGLKAPDMHPVSLQRIADEANLNNAQRWAHRLVVTG